MITWSSSAIDLPVTGRMEPHHISPSMPGVRLPRVAPPSYVGTLQQVVLRVINLLAHDKWQINGYCVSNTRWNLEVRAASLLGAGEFVSGQREPDSR